MHHQNIDGNGINVCREIPNLLEGLKNHQVIGLKCARVRQQHICVKTVVFSEDVRTIDHDVSQVHTELTMMSGINIDKCMIGCRRCNLWTPLDGAKSKEVNRCQYSIGEAPGIRCPWKVWIKAGMACLMLCR